MSSKFEEFKKEIKSEISSVATRVIAMFWTAGFLFSIGIVPFPDDFNKLKFLDQVGYLIIRWLLWALELGLHYK